jgi:hypothetical protein
MPQFDFYSFSSQVFWSLFGFLGFYFLILRFYLVNFSEVLKIRSKLTSSYLKVNANSSIIDLYSSFIILIVKNIK